MLASPLPSIHISLAPHEDPLPEPYSPFTPLSVATFDSDDDDSFRPNHLSPPPLYHRSPLRPASSPTSPSAQQNVKGLERDRFDALLKATRERNALVGAKRVPDLRKEVALKAHKSKQAERRALFLSKIEAPPSPSAISMPKTPPESPAVFHYTLPSPGLMSPLALFESLGLEDPQDCEGIVKRSGWVEQVDFRRPQQKSIVALPVPRAPTRKPSNRTKALPSLEQITAHFNSQENKPAVVMTVSTTPRNRIPLPAFLQTRKPDPPRRDFPDDAPARPMMPIGTGRLRLPIRTAPPKLVCPTIPCGPAEQTMHITYGNLAQPTPRVHLPPVSPISPGPKLQITTTVIPRTSSKSPTQLTEANLQTLNSRARTARDMMSTLRRRTPIPIRGNERVLGHRSSGSVDGNAGREMNSELAVAEADERKVRRISAPAELPRRDRLEFSHPVLRLPGGF
ncbi:hypothetical protein BD410DRAFT_780860 [Rickenella mellea]|uniref:Uncharacterized protein n=1 Tax=Rickenella mellea TaxID=50990 RepID=A0A4Y7QNA9_9AGAM|nr:hypothetical protein BD410DRAFT_780860 [Rickenella mellea]